MVKTRTIEFNPIENDGCLNFWLFFLSRVRKRLNEFVTSQLGKPNY